MGDYETQGVFACLDEIDAVAVAGRVDLEFVALGFQFIHLLAEDVIDKHGAALFAL